ncbi:MAG: NRDE family protein [Rhodospirillaceae bacterium]|nr:NRDE family protein [Rhodospirillaceae bacterium]
MCSVVILWRPGHDWPVIMAANRDEMVDRPWLPPARHWPDRPNVIAGLDRLAGGSWLGVNDEGVVAGVLNRMNSLGPSPGKRSRGELVLEALDHATARDAVQALADLDPAAYRPFNMVVADAADAFWLRNPAGAGVVAAMPLPPGVSMITAYDRNDPVSARTARYLPLFQAAAPPDPGDAGRAEPDSAEEGDWSAWERLVACRDHDPARGPAAAMEVVTDHGFQTTSSSLIALPGVGRARRRPVWRFAAGLPSEVPFRPIEF